MIAPVSVHCFSLTFTGVYIMFLFLGLSEVVLTCTHDLCFERKLEKDHYFSSEIGHFTAVKNRGILHGHVIIMVSSFYVICILNPLVDTEI